MSITKGIIHTLILSSMLTTACSCNGQDLENSYANMYWNVSASMGNTVAQLGKRITCMLQDKNMHYWFGSNGDGVYRFDGKNLTQLTIKHGLLSNFVKSIEEDPSGHLFFTTSKGVCMFNGVSWINCTEEIANAPMGAINPTKGGLIFEQANELSFYDGTSFTKFTIHPDTYTPTPTDLNRPYSIYSTLVDQSGNTWFGTQEKGVCRYDGNSFKYFTEHGLDKAAVRTLFQDKAGTIWAGNNGAGLFKFNGKEFTNFTDENGLGNRGFLNKLPGKEGTLARPWTINEDEQGNLWIGTIDAGVWKYDGTRLINYTTRDGLSSNAIWTIYKDKNAELWFVTEGEAICKFNGKQFTAFEVNSLTQYERKR